MSEAVEGGAGKLAACLTAWFAGSEFLSYPVTIIAKKHQNPNLNFR